MMRTMFDSTTPSAIPSTADLVAGYANGRWAWKPNDWLRWPQAHRVLISINAWYHEAIILDVEKGDASPVECNGWGIAARRVTGWIPTLYGTKATLDVCRRLAGEGGVEFDYGLADWTGEAHLPEGYAFCQYAAPGWGSPGHYDMSLVADWWPRRAVAPA